VRGQLLLLLFLDLLLIHSISVCLNSFLRAGPMLAPLQNVAS